MAKDHGSLPLKSNPHPFSDETTCRYDGGNTVPEVGEKHGQKKGQYVRAEQRAGLITNPGLENSPGRASSDVSKGA